MLMLTHRQFYGGQLIKSHIYRRFIISSTETVMDESSRIIELISSADVPYINCKTCRNVNVASFLFPRLLCPFIIFYRYAIVAPYLW